MRSTLKAGRRYRERITANATRKLRRDSSDISPLRFLLAGHRACYRRSMAVEPLYTWLQRERVSDTQTRLTFGVGGKKKRSVIVEDPWTSDADIVAIGNSVVRGYWHDLAEIIKARRDAT